MIKIISDSTCDLSKELLKKYDITILPLHIHLGEEEYEDGVNITPDEIYRWSDEHDAAPKTAAPSIAEAMDLFKPLLDAGHELLCFSISSQLSVSDRVMQLAAEELDAGDRVHVIDSANLSTSISFLLIEAAEMIRAGCGIAEICARMEALKPRLHTTFVVDTLTYLRRGGRCSNLAAVSGALLHIHPCIAVENSILHARKKYRGNIRAVTLAYLKDLEPALRRADKRRIFVSHSGGAEEALAVMRQFVEELQVFDEIIMERAGSVISSHCGPGSFGVLFIDGEE